jgi:hypothetical protein
MINAKSLKTVRNSCKMASRVARRWDGDWAQSFRIGDTLNVRLPGYYQYRSGAAANPGGYNDSWVPITLTQGGADIELTSKELSLNVDEFERNVSEPLAATIWQQMDIGLTSLVVPNATLAAANPLTGQGFNQFNMPYTTAGANGIGQPMGNLLPFVDGYAVAQTQSAVHTDDKVSGLLNPHSNASLFQGLSTLLLPTKEISEQYRNGSMGNAGGIDFFSTANSPALTLGTWSGTILYASGVANGSNSMVVSGMTGTFNAGEHFTVAGVNAVNPSGKGVQAELKHFAVISQVGTLITFSPPMILTGPLQNVNALPVTGAAIYPWGISSGTALAAGTGQQIKQNLVFHEDAILFAIGDLKDVAGAGGTVGRTIAASRMMDPMSGMRCRSLFWYDGFNDKFLYRLDVLWGGNIGRQGFGTVVVQ